LKINITREFILSLQHSELTFSSFGTKRPSLEQRYYEIYNQDNVDLIALKENPIANFTEKGIKMQDGTEHEFDVIILATGFDSVTGGLCQIDIKGTDGVALADKWSRGTWTYLGMTTSNFPKYGVPILCIRRLHIS
jgi:cation diffusion facilitator CzcD-associated flavoprotein CzcO